MSRKRKPSAPRPSGLRWIILTACCLAAGGLALALVDSVSRPSVDAPSASHNVPGAPPAVPVVRETYRIVHEYPHDPEAYTQGLVYVGGFLYEGTGLYGRSSLRKVELETGKTLRSSALSPTLFGEGVTIMEDMIYQLTWRSKTGFVYDMNTFSRLRTFQYGTQGWGLTHDGTYLIMSDGSSTLYYLHPETFTQVRRLEVHDEHGPVDQLNELEFIKGEIYANIWHSDDVVRISPATGAVVGRIDLSGLIDPARLSDPEAVLNGIAYDEAAGRLFVTGKRWPSLFEIEAVPR